MQDFHRIPMDVWVDVVSLVTLYCRNSGFKMKLPLFIFASLLLVDISLGQRQGNTFSQTYNRYSEDSYGINRKQPVRRVHPSELNLSPRRPGRPYVPVRPQPVRPVYQKYQPVRPVYQKYPPQRQQYQRPQRQQYQQQYQRPNQYQQPNQRQYQKTAQYNQYIPRYQKYGQNTYIPPNYKPKWPKLRGHCQSAPGFKINGVDPLKEQCKQGRAVVLFLMKRRCDFCYHQLKELNKLARHYFQTGKPLSIIVINHKKGVLAPSVRRQYPYLQIHEEPNDQDIFGKLGGAWRQIIIYDVCCRKQYLYGYPFSWMGYSFVRHAIFNTLYYDQVLCGVCTVGKPKKTSTKITVTTTVNPSL